jgi:hypothetical protein
MWFVKIFQWLHMVTLRFKKKFFQRKRKQCTSKFVIDAPKKDERICPINHSVALKIILQGNLVQSGSKFKSKWNQFKSKMRANCAFCVCKVLSSYICHVLTQFDILYLCESYLRTLYGFHGHFIENFFSKVIPLKNQTHIK